MLDPAWFLNLDAELELASAGRYAAPRRIEQRVAVARDTCHALTLGEPVYGRARLAPEHSIFCWCPTPSALGLLARLGLSAVAGPDLETLRQSNHRRWSLPPQPMLQRRFIEKGEPWRELLLETAPETGWRLKRPFGFAGRGQRRLPRLPGPDDLRWIEDSLRSGGLLREAEVHVDEEFSIHGYVDPLQLLLGEPVQFITDRFGAPCAFEKLEGKRPKLRRELRHAAQSVAERLRGLGYFGPFGVDAFSWQALRGLELNAVSDVNARFTLAWSLGMDELRLVALGRYAEQGLGGPGTANRSTSGPDFCIPG